MKLIHFSYNNPNINHPINGFDKNLRDFNLIKQGLNPICLIGINGSGKSKLLECIAEIFEYLIGFYTEFINNTDRTSIKFSIDYTFKLSRGSCYVRFLQDQEKGKPVCFIGKNEYSLTLQDDIAEIRTVLPETVLGYSSGENESLSQWFHPYIDEYREYYQTKAGLKQRKKIEELPDLPNMLWVDFSMNKLVFLANSVFSLDPDSKWNTIIKEVNTTDLRSFRMIVKLKPKKGPPQGIIAAQEQKNLIDALKRCCSASYDTKDREQSLILDYYYSHATYQAFKKEFKSAFNLYTALVKLDTLNLVLIKSELNEIKKVKKDTGEVIPRPVIIETQKALGFFGLKMHHKSASVVQYTDLSDGEHQFLHIFGTLNMIQNQNVLFLLDEPETHFNPQWRASFISKMTDIAARRDQEFIITTHSPFLLSDSKRDNVFIFEKENGKIKIVQPNSETYGASTERLLKIAFGIAPPVAMKSTKEMKKLISNDRITAEELEDRINDFGESLHKLGLYQKIRELKPKK